MPDWTRKTDSKINVKGIELCEVYYNFPSLTNEFYVKRKV